MENLNLIRKIAWSFHRSTRLDLDDLIQEASLAYLDGLKRYDNEYGNISTFMWRHITNQLITYAKREAEFHQPIKDIPDAKLVLIPRQDAPPIWERLTPDAQEVARIVVDGPKPYIKSRNEAQKRIQRVLKSQGWGKDKIRFALSDLKLCLS